MIDFSIDPADAALRDRVRAFVEQKVIPYEQDQRLTSHGLTDELRMELNALAREAGLLAPHVAKHFGGLGLRHAQRALIFEAAGYSTLGPVALHCAAPGIRVNAIGYGFVRTDLTAGVTTHPHIAARLLARTPMGRFGETLEVAGAAIFLASPAASYVTGNTRMVDGGWMAA